MTDETAVPGLSRSTDSFEHVWHRLPRISKAALIFVGMAIVFQITNSFVSGIAGSSNGITNRASSFDSSATGTGALAQLFAQHGHGIDRLASNISPALLTHSNTLFSLDAPTWSRTNTRGVLEVLRHAGVVVVSGRASTSAVLAVVAPSSHVSWRSQSIGVAAVSSPLPFARGVSELSSPGAGSFDVGSTGSHLQIIGRSSHGVLVVVLHRHGWLIALASTSALLDRQLAKLDNAAFALNLAGPSNSIVTFDEYAHGIGHQGAGLAGIPAPWRFGLAAILLALILWIVSASRRLGPPQERERKLIPPRIGFVDAMATLLRARPTSEVVVATATVREELRRSLARRFGLAPTIDDQTLLSLQSYSSPEIGSFSDLVNCAVTEPATNADVIKLGRALSSLYRARNSS